MANSLAPRIDRLESNTIINGNFDFWQRGIGIHNSNGYGSADRWQRQKTAPPAWEWNQSTDVPTLAQSGFQSTYSLLMDTTASPGAVGASEITQAQYRIEGYDFAKHLGNTFTICFWVKSAQARTCALAVRNGIFDRSYVSEYTIDAANTWEFKAIAVTHDGVGTWDVLNGIGATVILDYGSGTDKQTSSIDQWVAGNKTSTPNVDNILDNIANDVKIAQFQILPGDLTGIGVIPFRRAGRNIADELSMCQRYFNKSYELDTAPGTATSTNNYIVRATATQVAWITFPVTMRAIPTVVLYSNLNGQVGQWGSDGGVNRSCSATSIANTGVGSQNDGSTTAIWRGHHTADAEL